MTIDEQVRQLAREMGEVRGQLAQISRRLDSIDWRIWLMAGGALVGGALGAAGGAAALSRVVGIIIGG